MKAVSIAFKIFGGLVALIGILVLAGGIILMKYVDKPFIEKTASKALNRQVTVEAIDVSVLSALSGIEVKKVVISNFKTPGELEKLHGKPVAANDVFASLEAFVFKLNFSSILGKKADLRELVLNGLIINVAKSENGVYNFDDLTSAPPKKGDDVKKPAEKKEEPGKPLKASDLPLAIHVGKLGIEKGQATYYDARYKQTVVFYDIHALVRGLRIEPKNLSAGNGMTVEFRLGAKSIGDIKDGGVKNFDLYLSANGTVVPFDQKSSLLDPEVALVVGSPRGSVTGLAVFEKMKSVKALENYVGKLAFLKDTITWSNALVKIWYKDSTVALSDGKIITPDFVSAFGGKTNLTSKILEMKIDMTVDARHRDAMKLGLKDNLKKVITPDMARYVNADTVTEEGFRLFLNEKGEVYIAYDIKGTWSSPEAAMTRPAIPAVRDVVAQSARQGGDRVRDEAAAKAAKVADEKKKEAESAVKQKAAEGASDVRKRFGL